ncbi:uncharacterized protein LOC142341184 [Convolutriloba macropyga]|uniref:uncharacterized protein LOC142341184 n=1 Tax=Convolutriloba macropyga TaxID=536237 RepID=UPI003F526273
MNGINKVDTLNQLTSQIISTLSNSGIDGFDEPDSGYETLQTLGAKMSRVSQDLTTEVYGSTKSNTIKKKAVDSNRQIQQACKMFVSYGVIHSPSLPSISSSSLCSLGHNESRLVTRHHSAMSRQIETEIELMREILVRERQYREAECRYTLFMAEKRRMIKEGKL